MGGGGGRPVQLDEAEVDLASSEILESPLVPLLGHS